MARRLLAFALAFVVIGAPLAGDACEAFCAAHAGQVDPTLPVSHHHAAASLSSHHHHSEPSPVPASRTGNTALRPVAHDCVQSDAVVAESRELTRAPIAAAAASVPRLTPTLAQVLSASDIDGGRRPPTAIRSTAPLRI